MDKEELNQVNGNNESDISGTPNRQAYIEYMRSKKGDDYGANEEDMYSDMLSYRKANDESMSKLSSMLSNDPRLAQVLSDVSEGKRGATAALVRYFGKDVLGAEEDSEEWEEIEEAEKERLSELEKARKDKEEYDASIEASGPVLKEFAKNKGIDLDNFLDTVYDRILEPVFAGKYTPELLEMLNNAINYEGDVEESFKSGVVAGRNQKIDNMRKERKGDGLPRMGVSSGGDPVVKEQKSKYRSSVWDD